MRVKWPGRFIDIVSCQLGKELTLSTTWKSVLQIRLTDPSLRKLTAEQKFLFGFGNNDFYQKKKKPKQTPPKPNQTKKLLYICVPNSLPFGAYFIVFQLTEKQLHRNLCQNIDLLILIHVILQASTQF